MATMKNPRTIFGVDPGSRRTGVQAWSDLSGAFGGLSDDWIPTARGLINYNDPTGQAEIGGADYNRLLEAGAGQWGHTFTPWSASPTAATPPTGGSPTAPPSGGINIPGAPRFTAPKLTLGRLARPKPFEYSPFAAPTMQEVAAEPGYAFGLEQGQKAIERSAAGQGLARTGSTLKDLLEYGQDYAGNRYNDVYGRKFNEWQTGRAAAEGDWERDWRSELQTQGINTDADLAEYEAAFRGAGAEYDPAFAEWQARLLAGDRNADREWQRYVYGTDDAYRRERDKTSDAWRRDTFKSDDDWRKYVYGREDWWRQQDFDEARRRFLAEMGR